MYKHLHRIETPKTKERRKKKNKNNSKYKNSRIRAPAAAGSLNDYRVVPVAAAGKYNRSPMWPSGVCARQRPRIRENYAAHAGSSNGPLTE